MNMQISLTDRVSSLVNQRSLTGRLLPCFAQLQTSGWRISQAYNNFTNQGDSADIFKINLDLQVNHIHRHSVY